MQSTAFENSKQVKASISASFSERNFVGGKLLSMYFMWHVMQTNDVCLEGGFISDGHANENYISVANSR